VSSAARSRHYPDVPTVAEAGVPGYQAVAWYGVVGPKNMPPEILKKVTDEVVRAIGTEPVRRVIDSQGGDMVGGSAAAFGEFLAAERKRYETIVRAAGISVE
jgi:tripartite-type tricarboxylate transporter receptor subunit TctC